MSERPAAAETCAMCPKMCRFACPVARATHSDAVHPTGLATAVLRGDLRVAYECTMCLGCNTYCALDQDVPAYLRRARAEAVRTGTAPERVMEIGLRGGRPHGTDVSVVVGEAVKEALQTDTPGEADVVYFPSCTALAKTPEIVFAVIAILQAANVRVRVVHPGCCGGIYGDLGHTELAERLSGEARDAIEKARGPRVVTDGPLCARTLPATPFPVFADELVRAGRLAPRRVEARAAYHDPCVLGRHLRVYDAPRRVLGAVFGGVIELAHSRERARCSGGGAGLPATDPEASRAIAAERLDEARAVDAELLVSACPQCKVQFRGGDVPVRDLSEVLAGAL